LSHDVSERYGAGITSVCIVAVAVGVTVLAVAQPPNGSRSMTVVAAMRPIATVSERYQSYNVEMAEVIGGNFWKPYASSHGGVQPSTATTPQSAGQDPTMFQKRPPIDLSSSRLRKLAAALGPAYMRTSGTWANMVYFHDADTPPPTTAPTGFQGVLTRTEWHGVIDFAHVVDAKLVSSFTISPGVRNAAGVWAPDQARRFVNYTKAAGGEIAAAEFFNEPDMPSFGGAPKGYTAEDYARDFAVFKQFARATVPQMQIVGPGSVGEGTLMTMMDGGGLAAGLVPTAAMLAANPRPVFDIFSYHHYGAASQRCAAMGAGAQTTPDAALSEEWLSRTDKSYEFYRPLRDQYEPGTSIWITETADAACGGNPWAAQFLDTFRYLDQMGRLARRGVSVIFHNTLASSEYGLLDQNSLTPRPNYWAAVLWHRLMGTTVLEAAANEPGFHVYAQCLPEHPGGVTVLAINTSLTQSRSIEVPKAVEQYTLSAKTLDATTVELNGRELNVGTDDALPAFQPVRIAAGRVTLAPTTISFMGIADAGNAACR